MIYSKQVYNILIVDDHQLIIDGLAGILRDEKIIGTIQSACNGREAIEKVINSEIDLVLMDINMPVMNGYDASKLIKQQKPYIKIIIISILSDVQNKLKALRADVDAFIRKDTDKDELLKAIEKVMRNEKYMNNEFYTGLHKYTGKEYTNLPGSIQITTREKEIIGYMAQGVTNSQIADKLFLSAETIEAHRRNILAKLNLKNTAALIKYAIENEIV